MYPILPSGSGGAVYVSSRGAAEQEAPVSHCLFAKACLQGFLFCDLAAACIMLQLDRTGGKPFHMESLV